MTVLNLELDEATTSTISNQPPVIVTVKAIPREALHPETDEGTVSTFSNQPAKFPSTEVISTGHISDGALTGNVDKDEEERISINEKSLSYLSDFGFLIKRTMSINDVVSNIKSLSEGQVYHLLKHHSTPSELFIFPESYTGGCNRSFKLAWIKEYSWLVYSNELDGAFCKVCALFAKGRENLGILVNWPFTKLQKKSEVMKNHAKCDYHLEALEIAKNFKMRIEHKIFNILIDSKKKQNIFKNCDVLKTISQCVLFCARQCIALRGNAESDNKNVNPGNFRAVLNLVAEHNDGMKEHLQNPGLKNCKYTSSLIQNDICLRPIQEIFTLYIYI
jgi:hypothetical protein